MTFLDGETPSQCPGPFKPHYTISNPVEKNVAFLKKLFDNVLGPGLRQSLWNSTENQLRQALLAELGINLHASVHIMLVDIENGRCKSFADPAVDCWYTWMLPPAPRRSSDYEYLQAQTLEGAYHHAVVDGYGM